MEEFMLFGRFYCKKALSRGRCGGATPALGVAEKTGGRARGLWSAGGRPLLIFFVSFCRNNLTHLFFCVTVYRNDNIEALRQAQGPHYKGAIL